VARVSTPYDPQREGQQPEPGPYGGGQQGQDGTQQPGQYGQPDPYTAGQPGPYGQQPGPYGAQPYPGQQHGEQQYSGAYPAPSGPGYAYNPYGTPYPAGLGDSEVQPVVRPGIMVLSLVLFVLSTLPFLVAAAFLLLVPLDAQNIPPELLNSPELADAGVTPDLLISVLRVGGAILLVIALLYVLFAVLAFQGRNWARIVVTVLTAGFTLLLLSGVAGAGDLASLVFLLLVLAASVAGTVILFLPDSSRFFASRRRR